MDPDDVALARAMALSLEEAKHEDRRRAQHKFPHLRKVTASDGSLGITIDGRTGDWVEGELVPRGVEASAPRCVCIRMTIGSFRGYTSRSLLHTGVSTSTGEVYNFDERGHHCDAWTESINYPLHVPSLTDEGWDKAVRDFDAAHRARNRPYVSLGYNCYNYVVDFLNSICYGGRTDHTVESFAAALEPAILPAVKYIQLYQQLQEVPMVLSGKQAPLGKHPVHPEHDLFANPMARGYMCDVCGGSDSRRFTCTQGCDTDVCGACWDASVAATHEAASGEAEASGTSAESGTPASNAASTPPAEAPSAPHAASASGSAASDAVD